jgi:hypothetical protein
MSERLSVRKVMGMYATIAPQDRRDAVWILSRKTAEDLATEFNANFDPETLLRAEGATMLGIRVEFDDAMERGAIALETESALERSIRRIEHRGNVVHVYRPMISPPVVPTLKALLRHWRKKMTR